MNEHDMISNISYIMHCYPEMTNEILIKHGANPDNEFWTTGCDIASAYEEILKFLESRYDRNDQDTQLDYRIQEILGWHDVNESVESELEIPAPYNKYYEIGMLNDGSIPEDEIPDAFDYYDMKLLAVAYAKEQYEDALADNCLDYCYLIKDADGLALVTTAGLRVYNVEISEIERCLGITEDFDVREPSSVEYGNFITNYHRELAAKIEKYDIAKIEENRRYVEYYGKINGHEFLYTEGKADSGTYAKELYIDSKEVDVYHSGTFHMGINGVGEFGLMTLIKLLENNDFSNIVFKSDDLDDYTESLVEDTEMSDAQRLALQELDSCLEYGELDAEKHALAYQIQWDINFEDVLLFINGIDIDLKDIKHVEYGDCSNEYDGCYDVTLHNGTTKQYGWHDFDMTGSLYLIEDFTTTQQRITESASSIQWTDLYQYKYSFRVTPKYSPNSTYGDDCLRRANDCGCIRIIYSLYPTSQDVSLYLCKTPEQYESFISSINNSSILRDYARISELRSFDFADVASNLEARFQAEIDRVASRRENARKVFTKEILKRLQRGCPAVYVDDYTQGHIRVELPCSNMHPFNETEDTTTLTESDDGWDKPFGWTERYVKDGFAIYDNYQGGWHVEQTRPKTKHFGNFKTLDAAKAAADAEINKRNRKNADKPVQFGVHSFNTDSIIFRGTEDECAEYINNNGLENEAEIYRMDANDRYYLEESASNQFSIGDRVYVRVSNRQGTVTKMVSDDVVEVEFEANGTYPARTDRFYTSEVELIDMTPDHDEDVNEEYWAVFATDLSTGKEYCSGVYGSERDAYYWAGMDRYSDTEYNYGNFKYRVERVSDYSDALDKSKRELDTLKLFNHSTHKVNDIDDDF